MARVAVVASTYAPEPVVSAQMARDLAVYLAANAAEVKVLCAPPSRPIGTNYTALHPRGKPLVRVEDGIEVVRLPSFTAPQSRLWPRMWESWSFGRQVCRYLSAHPSAAEVVYAVTWPILSPALISQYCARRGIPLVFHIKDLYPESLLPKLPGWLRKPAALPLLALDRWSVSRARHTVVLSESLRHAYLTNRRLPAEKVTTLLDWADERQYEQPPARAKACAQYGVPEKLFTFLYLGNIGPVAGVELLIESFHGAALKEAQLVIVGDGSAKAKCVELAKKLEARNVRFIADPEAANVPLLQSLGHICLLPMRRGAGASSIPSKLMAYLLSGKPVLASLDPECDTARCIRESGCGWVGAPEDPAWLASKMAEVEVLPSEVLAKMGQQGRAYGLKHFSRSEGVQRLANLVLAAGEREKAAAGLPRSKSARSVEVGA